MPEAAQPRKTRAIPTRRRTRMRAARDAVLAMALLGAALAPPALASPGTGTAIILGPSAVAVTDSSIWTIQYTPTENFSGSGGTIDIVIPPGWTPPQTSNPTSPGYVNWTDANYVSSVTITGDTIRLLLGAPPQDPFQPPGASVSVLYGAGGGHASAHPQTTVQDTVYFNVLSDPTLTGSPAPLPSSPWVSVIAGRVVSATVVDGADAAVGSLVRTTDQDTTQLFLRGHDAYGNRTRLICADWTLSGGVGGAVPANGTGTALRLDTPGTGYAIADSAGVWSDSTGAISVVHGAYAGLEMTAPGSASAGTSFPVTARSRDADGNTITGGPGSAASLTYIAFADSVGPAPADPNLVSAAAALSSGAYSGSLTARKVGAFYISVIDSATGFVSSRHRVAVSPGGPDRIALRPDTLRLTAGVPDTVTVRVTDAFGNRSPVSASETLTLWTDRPAGAFQNVAGTATIFEVTIPAGADSVRFRFRDTQTTTAEGRLRAIDANGNPPFLGTAGAPVFTAPNVPAAVVLTATQDTLVADGADSVFVAGAARDAFGNAVAQGERFTFDGGALLTEITDQDPGAAGAQLLADSTGAVGGYVRAGTTSGSGAATAQSERGSAAGSVPIHLLAGAPSGAVALSAPTDSLAADSLATLIVSAASLRDANGNKVENGEKYTVATTLGAIQNPDADPVAPGRQILAAGGGISLALFGGDSLGTAQVTATALRNGLSNGSMNVRLVPGAVSASRSAVSADSPVPVGPSGSVVAVTLRDRQDHPLGGVPADSIGVSVVGASASVTPLASATNPAGRIDFRATASVPDTGSVNVSARGVPLAAQPSIVFQPGPLDHYTVAGPAGPLTAGAGITLTVTAHDSFGNSLPGQSGNVLRPTVTSGGATVPDSVVLAGGAASIPVTPTLASPLTIVVSDGPRSTTYGPVAVNPSSAATLTISPDSLSLTPTQAGTVTVTARDGQGNPVPGLALTVFLGGPSPKGSLESLGPTSGGPGSQGGLTDGSGRLAARYRAPSTAPEADSIFASGGSLAAVGIRAATAPGATVALRVSPRSLSWTAGVPESVRVEATDSFGNVTVADGAAVTMRGAGSVAWSPAGGPLVAGRFVTTGRDTVAEPIAIGADRAGGGSGTGGTATVSPGAPSGAIAFAATRDSLTADGRSAATVVLGPVRDAFGNLVGAGTLVGVSAQAGTLLASDQSALFPGLDLATAADGKASLVLIAPTTPGPDTLAAATRAGSSTGSHAFTYVPPPSLAYVGGTAAPGAVLPGSSASFTLQARNTGAGAIQLGTGSVFSFGSGATTFTAALGSATTLGAGAAATLTFAPATVPDTLTPGAYAPSFRALGVDGTGAAFDFYPSLAGSQVSVLGIGVAAVSASPDPAPLGYQNLSLVFDVANLSGTPGDLSGGSLSFSTGAFISGAPTPALGTTIPAGGSTRFTFPVAVPSGGIPSGTTVNATLQATASFAGTPVVASNSIPLTFRVTSAARVAAAAGSGTPPRLLRGRTSAPTVRVSNTGASAVTLHRSATRLVLDSGATTLATGLSANTAVLASDQATLAFDSLAVPAAGVPKARYRARLFLDGTESGQAFADTISFAPDSVDVLDPALLTVLAGSLAPDTVSAGQSRPVSLTLRNNGDVPFALDASTALKLAAPVSVTRSLGASPTLNAGQSLVLAFPGAPLGSAASPGDASATLDVFGFEEGVARARSLSSDTLHAMPPAVLQFVARSTTPSEVRPGQTVDFTLGLRNTGGSPFAIDPAQTRLSASDGSEIMTGLASGAAFVLGPSAQATLTFPGVLVPAAMASQPYRLDLAIAGTEWGLAANAAATSPDSELVVLGQLSAIQVRGIDTAVPVQVASGGPSIRAWGLELTPLVQAGVSTRDSLASVAITVLADGSPGVPPASSVSSISLRDRAGALLAQGTPSPGAPNPLTLSLSQPLIMAGGAESLFVEIAFRAGAPVGRMAIQLARGNDVLALDALTGARAPISGGGGLPFAALTSREITFFDRPHGYPNPFHAGSEAVLLSYVLGQDAPVKVSIYTLLGDLVRELSLPSGSAGGVSGLNEVRWDGRNGKGEIVRPGVYVARIDGPGVSEQIKVGVLR